MSKGRFPTPILLADLDAPVGVKLDGEAKNQLSGYSVDPAGDMNRDGYADFLIGGPGYGYSAGCTYLIYGDPRLRQAGLISMGGLNGTIGSKLLGGNMADKSGSAVGGLYRDVNGDGYFDFLVGAPGYKSNTGRTYLIYGGANVGRTGTIVLETLDGKTGVILDGENSGDQSGWAVGGADDFSGDGFPELLIGAWGFNSYTGCGYVVYGGSNLNGLIALGSLNGITGLRAVGEHTFDYSSISVSSAGRFNGGSWPAIAFGSEYNSNSVGLSHVLFIYPGVGVNTSGLIQLANLSGPDGFKIQGVSVGDQTGNAIVLIPDLDGDGWQELLIAARGFNNSAGRVYVVRGGPGVGASGIIALSDLNGVTGFTLGGGVPGDKIGWDLGSGDVNGDGFGDLLIGAPGTKNGNGRIYGVFGGPDIGLSGYIDLDNLDGHDGIILEGETGSQTGISVNGVGDADGDGIEDVLAGGQGFNNSQGRSYLWFGDAPPKLWNNTLSLSPGERLLLNSTYLAATDRNHDNSSLIFFPTGVVHGQFENVNKPGVAILNFTQQLVWDDIIQFVHDGSSQAPSYNMTVRSDGIAWTGPEPASINFRPVLPVLVNNQLFIIQGQCFNLTSDNLLATEVDIIDPTLNFTISELTHGQFSVGQQSSVPWFLQQSVLGSSVMFCHDDSISPPSYKVAVSYDGVMTTPQPCAIKFDLKPIVESNQFLLPKGQRTSLTSDNIRASHAGIKDPALQFIVTDVQHGQFEQVAVPGSSIESFLQKDIETQNIVFVHDNSTMSPEYQLTVTDGFALSPVSPGLTLLVLKNYLPINQNEVLWLTEDNVDVVSQHLNTSEISFTVSDVERGEFESSAARGRPIPRFTQSEIAAGTILFVPDGSSDAPLCDLIVGDQNSSYGMLSCNVDFATPPTLESASFEISLPGSIRLTTDNLRASDRRIASGLLVFTVSQVENGYFSDYLNQSLPLSSFTQQDVIDGRIFFNATSDSVPAFMVSVSNGRMNCTGCPQAGIVTPADIDDQPDDKCRWYPYLLLLLAVPASRCITEKVTKTILHAYENGIDRAITNAILDQFWIGCWGVITCRQYAEYVETVGRTVVDPLQFNGAGLRGQWAMLLPAQQQTVMEEIAGAAKNQLIGQSNFGIRFFKSFCASEVTPRQLELQAANIVGEAQPRLGGLP